MVKQDLRSWAAVALALAMGWAIFLVIDAPPMTRSEVADWAQGLGTIAAVAVAAWAGSLPARLEQQARAQRRRDYIRAVSLAATYGVEGVSEAIDALRARNPTALRAAAKIVLQTQHLRALRKVLDEPLSAWPSTALYMAAVRLLDRHQEFCLELEAGGIPDNEKAWASLQVIAQGVLISRNSLGRFGEMLERGAT